jgi:dolichyl-diphosphooligosaccharide--protein glycosyltransferase
VKAAGIAAVAALVIYPNTGPLPGGDRPFHDVATRGLFVPSDAWYETLTWMRDESAETMGDPGYYYYRDYTKGWKAASFSTACLWDYGYWVSRIGHRVPLANPGDPRRGEPNILLAQDQAAADNISRSHNIRYIIINDYTVDRDGGFGVLASESGMPTSRYFETFYRRQGEKLLPTPLYYPGYYRSLAVRLYCFDGSDYSPTETAVVSWEYRNGADGKAFKEITGLRTFVNYRDAEAYVSARDGSQRDIVGKDPRISPVPLDALEGYKPVYSSSQKSRVGNGELPEVRVFERITPGTDR